jgi:hypothetical protein
VEHLLHGGSQANADLLADAAAAGITLPEQITKPKRCIVWAEHWPAVELFIRCVTQWRAGASGVIGLDYGVVFQMASLYQIQDDLPRVMEDLQIMELHARDLINKAAAKESK